MSRSLLNEATEGQVLELLADRFPGESDATYQELYDRGVQAWQAGSQFNLFDPNYPITRGQLPTSGGLPHGYSFYANVEVFDPFTGSTVGTSVKLDFASVPDQESFTAALQQQIFDSFGPDSELPSDKYKIEDPQLANFRVYAVELSR